MFIIKKISGAEQLYSGGGANNNIGTQFGLKSGEIVELVRVALNGKQPCTSECVGASIKQLHKDAPQIKMIVSYADMDQDHAGTIYQATNWIYLGDTLVDKKDGAYIIHGKKMHGRTISSKGWKHNETWLKKYVDPNAHAWVTRGKHKYLWVYDKKMRKQWQKKSLPYPKKENKNDSIKTSESQCN